MKIGPQPYSTFWNIWEWVIYCFLITYNRGLFFAFVKKNLFNQSTYRTGTLRFYVNTKFLKLALGISGTYPSATWKKTYDTNQILREYLEHLSATPNFFFWSVSHIIILLCHYFVIYSKSPQESFENLLFQLRLLKSRSPLIILISTIGLITMLIAVCSKPLNPGSEQMHAFFTGVLSLPLSLSCPFLLFHILTNFCHKTVACNRKMSHNRMQIVNTTGSQVYQT